jgi:hypothetical protein
MLDHYLPRYPLRFISMRPLHVRIPRRFCVPQTICHILHKRFFNTFRIFSEYAERMKNTQKEILTFNSALGHERVISKKYNWKLNTGVG